MIGATALTPRPFLRPEIELQGAMLEAGGEWMVGGDADPEAVVAEARQRGVRALSVARPDIGFVRDLPDLEFLRVGDCRDVTPALDAVLDGSDLAEAWDEQGPGWREQARAMRDGLVNSPA